MSLAICQMNIICWYFLDGDLPSGSLPERFGACGEAWSRLGADCWWLMQGGTNRGGRDFFFLLLFDMIREKLERSFPNVFV